MQTSNGAGVDLNANSVNPTSDARHASNVNNSLTPSQVEFWYLIESQSCNELARSLRMVHDLALYHSDVPFNAEEKSALFDVKVLWEGLEKIEAKV